MFNHKSDKLSDLNRQKTENSIRSHWAENPISLRELIQERWEQKPADGSRIKKFNYIVFLDCDGDLDWIANGDYSEEQLPDGTTSLIAKIIDAESYPSTALDDNHIRSYKLMLGHAIVSALEGDRDSALSLLEQALHYLQGRVSEKSRAVTLWISISLTAMFWGITSWLGASDCMWGLFGAFVSLVRRSCKRSADANAGICMHIVEVVAFLFAGMLLGRLGVVLLNSPLAPQTLKGLCETPNGVIIMAFLSGMSQGFIPSMISKYAVAAERASA